MDDDPDLDGEPALLYDLPILIALLAGAIAIVYILYSNWTTSPRRPFKQEPSSGEEDTISSEANEPEYLTGDSDDSDENEMDIDLPEDEEYYMVNIDHGLMRFKKIEDETEQERLHEVIEHEVSSSDEENESDLDLTPEEYEECMKKLDERRRQSLKKPSEGDAIDKHEREPHFAATEVQKPSGVDTSKQSSVEEAEQETRVGRSREDVGPVEEHKRDRRPSSLDQGTVQLSDSYVEITAADVPERKVEKKVSIEEEDDTTITQGSLRAEREDITDTATLPTSISVEGTVRKISSGESREDTSMEKEELEGGEDEATFTERTATETSSDESREDVTWMEKKKKSRKSSIGDALKNIWKRKKSEVQTTSLDSEDSVTPSVPITESADTTTIEIRSDESREDVIPKAKDGLDEELEDEGTATEGTATELTPDKTEVRSGESREDVIPKPKDDLDVDQEGAGAKPDYVRVSGSVHDAGSTTFDNGEETRENDEAEGNFDEEQTQSLQQELTSETELSYPRRHSEFEEPFDVDTSKQSSVEETEQETRVGGSREDVGPVEEPTKREGRRPSSLDQGTVQLSDSYVEITAADVPERKEVEEQVSIEEEDDTTITQGSLRAEREDITDTATLPTSISVEGTVRKISSYESRDSTSMEKEELEGGEDEATFTERAATETSSDESREDVTWMEKKRKSRKSSIGDALKKLWKRKKSGVQTTSPDSEDTVAPTVPITEYTESRDVSLTEKDDLDEEVKDEGTATEGTATELTPDKTEVRSDESREDVIPKPKDDLDVDQEGAGAKPDYVRVSGSVHDAGSTTFDNGEDQSRENDEAEESCDEEQTQSLQQELTSETELSYPRRHSEFEEPSDVDTSKQSSVEETEEETRVGGSGEDVGPVEHGSTHDVSQVEMPSNLDQGTVQLNGSCTENNAADHVAEREVEEKLAVDEEGAIPIAQEIVHAESEDVDTASVLTQESVEEIATEMSLDERDDSTMEKDTFDEEHKGGEDEVTSTEETAKEGSSDEMGEDDSAMEKDTFDEEHEGGENEVTSTEDRAREESSDERDDSTMEKDTFDEEPEGGEDEVTSTEDTAREESSDEREDSTTEKDTYEEHEGGENEYVRVSSSIMQHRLSRISPVDVHSIASDNGEVMISSSSTEVGPCGTSTMESNETPREDQTSEINEDDENLDEDQIQNSQQESPRVDDTQEEQQDREDDTTPSEDDGDDEWED